VYGSAYVTATINEKSTQPLFRNLYALLRGILGTNPPLIKKAEELESLLMGKSNGLMLVKEPSTSKPGDFYSNVVALMPLAPGSPIPTAPASYTRDKFREKKQVAPQAAPAQYVTPSQPVAPPVIAAPAQRQPTAEEIQAFLASQVPKNNTSF
jgi:hypothetical protein